MYLLKSINDTASNGNTISSRQQKNEFGEQVLGFWLEKITENADFICTKVMA